jgi:phosphoribosylformimino-5-aminoimidazole carboxamide ribonucleotide (ProFAR) isomerase
LLNIVGVSGVITGKAIYENRFTVAEAIAAANAGRQ